VVIPPVAYACYDAQIEIDLLIIYLYLLLPLGFLLLEYSTPHRWIRLSLTLSFVALALVTYAAVQALPSKSEPGSAIQSYGALYGPWIVGLGLLSLLLGVFVVPRRIRPGHCPACGYELRGLTEPRCPECGTPFDPKLLEETTQRNRHPDGE
jgi:hypothetical protein